MTSYDDFLAMQALTQHCWPSNPRWSLGELTWGWSSPPEADRQGWRTRVWTAGTRCLAWGWLEPPGDLNLLVDPAAPELVDEVLDWFDEVAEAGEHTCSVLETETALVSRLEAREFAAEPDRPFFRYHAMSLHDLPDPILPAGCRMRHVRSDEVERRAEVHRVSWAEFGSTLSAERYARVMAAWPYRADLDWVVETTDGRWVASALCWLDDVNQCAILEPVGCDPEYRRRGLAGAVSIGSLLAARAAGARTGLVNPRGDAGYPAPGLLYRGIGFRPGPRTVTYVRAGTLELPRHRAALTAR